ncbi:MAG TPA: nuclear transport factor 2 family protein [Methylomirabilota bacterium]|jgi:ketosteroid isomerase-like protein|nr:nuclear transport factor 2 family protein [Methylomirabilota bacterium]
MRSRSIVGVTVVLALGVAVLSAMAADKGEQEVRTLIPKIAQAWESLDIGRVDPYYAKDADLAFFDIAPLKYANWAEYRAGVQKMFFEPNRSLKFTLRDDLRVHRRGSLAWATFTFGADVVNKQGASSHLDGRWTLILEQRKGNWTVLHEHVSVPLGS